MSEHPYIHSISTQAKSFLGSQDRTRVEHPRYASQTPLPARPAISTCNPSGRTLHPLNSHRPQTRPGPDPRTRVESKHPATHKYNSGSRVRITLRHNCCVLKPPRLTHNCTFMSYVCTPHDGLIPTTNPIPIAPLPTHVFTHHPHHSPQPP